MKTKKAIEVDSSRSIILRHNLLHKNKRHLLSDEFIIQLLKGNSSLLKCRFPIRGEKVEAVPKRRLASYQAADPRGHRDGHLHRRDQSAKSVRMQQAEGDLTRTYSSFAFSFAYSPWLCVDHVCAHPRGPLVLLDQSGLPAEEITRASRRSSKSRMTSGKSTGSFSSSRR